MKILFLTHTYPYPLDDGVRLHVYYLLKYLALDNEIALLSLSDAPVGDEGREAILKLGVRSAEVVVHPIMKSPWDRLLNCLFDPVPFFVRQFQSPAFGQSIKRALAGQTVDVIHADYLSLAIYLDAFAGRPAVAFPHDAVSMLFERSLRRETGILRRFYQSLQFRKILRFEIERLPLFKSVAVVSEVDRQYLLRRLPGLKIAVVTNGVDTEYFMPQPDREAAEPTILFRGVMNFFPNHDAALYFYKEIFPKIRVRQPGARFIAAGKNPDPMWRRLAQNDPGLRVTGYVEDMREIMAQAWVVACPMRAASGIQNKVLEPMAMGKAIVATPLATEGLRLTDGQHVMLAQDPEAFAQKVLALLADAQLRRQLGDRAREHVLSHHHWRSNAVIFNKLYKEAASF